MSQSCEVPDLGVTFEPVHSIRNEGNPAPVSQRRVYVNGRPDWVDEGHANGTARWPGSGSAVGGTRLSSTPTENTWSLHGPRLPNGPKGKLAKPQPGEEAA